MKQEDSQNKHDFVTVPHPRLYEAMTDYYFRELPFMCINYWTVSSTLIFARWIMRLDQRNAQQLLVKIPQLLASTEMIGAEQLITFQHAINSSRSFKFYCNARIFYYSRPESIELRSFQNIVKAIGPAGKDYMHDRIAEGIYPIHIKNVVDTTSLRIEIILPTDLWFPWIVGFAKNKPAITKEEMYDNRQLAWGHTPRLNRCLAEIKQLVLDTGGTWEIGTDDIHEQYQHMVTETGIDLNMPDGVSQVKKSWLV